VQLFRQLPARVRQLPASLLMMAGFILSRLTGLLRDLLVSYQFGTSSALAAYNAAVTLTDLLYMVIIGGALGTAFLPVFSQRRRQSGDAAAWQLFNAVVSWALIVLGAASLLIWAAAPLLAPLLYGGRGFDAATLTLTADLMRLFLLSPLLLGLGGLAAETLKVRQHFLLPALIPTLYNLGMIGGALFAPQYGIFGLAWGVVAGAALYLLVQLPLLYRFGLRFVPTIRAEAAAVRRIAVQMGPRVLGQAAAQISLVVTLALAARLDDGDAKVSALRYAMTLMMLPFGIFALSLSSVAFARMADQAAAGNSAAVQTTIRVTLGRILWLTLPATAVLLALGEPLARLLFERGAFDARSLGYTGNALFGYALALPAFAASEILVRSFYALQRTWPPVLVGLGQVLLNLTIGSVLISRGADLAAIATGFAIANSIEALLLIVWLQRDLPGLWRNGPFIRTVLGATAASALVGGLLLLARILSADLVRGLQAFDGYRWQSDLAGLLLWNATAGLLALALYGGLSLLLQLAPAREIAGRLIGLRRR
jgi:putative peptidoglycan lipid II flippase